MAVYVDNARIPYRRMLMCHMFADTKAELHAMADAIGLRRAWFQTGSVLFHYDVSLTKREEAIKRGAIPVDRQWVKDRIRQVLNAKRDAARPHEPRQLELV